MLRSATKDDARRIGLLYERMHEELLRFGGLVRPGEAASAWVQNCLALALDGEGRCIVDERDGEAIGVSLAVEMPFPFPLTIGKRVACGVGTYVDPAYRKIGVADGLYVEMKRQLAEAGFDAYLGAYLPENRAVQGLLMRNGAHVLEHSVYFPLLRGGLS